MILALVWGAPAGLAAAPQKSAPAKPPAPHAAQVRKGKPAAGSRAATKVPTKARTKAAPTGPRPVVPQEIQALGPLSVGHPHEGFLVNAVQMPRSPYWVITLPSHGYATQETVDALSHCLRQVHEAIPDSPATMLGSLSAEHGGLLPPHKSHRTGRDVDVYFFRNPGARWNEAATREDLDLPRTWALLRCFATETDVEMILIDRKVQLWIEEYAASLGEDPEWIRDLFHDDGPAKTALIRHVPGHVAHMHVRFVSAKARRAAVAAYDRLVKLGLVNAGVAAIEHRVQAGETLSGIAKRYGTSVKRIQDLNRLKSSLIRVGQRLTLQQAVDVRGARERVVVPPRRLPPKAATTGAPRPTETQEANATKENASDAVNDSETRSGSANSKWM